MGRTASRPVGTLILRIDPESYLYPYLKQWPTPSETAETLLVRREGEEVVFLNELRFRRGTALNLRFPLTQAGLPAAAAAQGETGLMRGHGLPRRAGDFAYVGSVPGSPWALVARMDMAEVHAPDAGQAAGNDRHRRRPVVRGAGRASGWSGGSSAFQSHLARFEAERERAWLQDVIARSLNEIYVYDPETLRFIFANAGACRNLGYSLAELTELTPPDIDPAYSLAGFQALLGPLRSGEQGLLVFETVHRRKDGSEYPVEVHLQRVRSGERAYFLAISVDITERKRAEEALTASEVRYRRLFEAARDGILILDAETGMVVDVNPFLVEMLGYSREQFLGKRIWELGFFKDIAANKANFLELQQKEYIRYEDLPLETAEGRWINVEFVSNVYLVNDNKVIQCNIRDITERKRAEKELQVLSSRNAAILAAVPDIIAEVDQNKIYTWVNRAGTEFFGEGVIGKEAAFLLRGRAGHLHLGAAALRWDGRGFLS